MQLETKKFTTVVRKLLDEIELNLPQTITIENEDLYWHLDEEEVFNPLNEPKTPVIGQLTDDWQELQRILIDGEPLSYDLNRVSAIMLIIRRKSIGIW